jgi:biotin synthase
MLEELRDTGLKLILCLGERSLAGYQQFAQKGADGYIIKFESSHAKHFADITGRSLESRLQCIKYVREAGLLLGTGFIAGLPGQSVDMIAEDILLCKEIRPDFVSVSPFVPNENTPFESEPPADVDTTLNSLALLRILLPHASIPTVSVLEKLRKGGQLDGLKAGANVITVNFTPPKYRDAYQIYSRKRFVVNIDHALDTICRAGLLPDRCR